MDRPYGDKRVRMVVTETCEYDPVAFWELIARFVDGVPVSGDIGLRVQVFDDGHLLEEMFVPNIKGPGSIPSIRKHLDVVASEDR
jgi:hypothetical protein